MGFLSSILDPIIGGNLSAAPPPDMPLAGLRGMEAKSLADLFRNPLQSDDWRAMMSTLASTAGANRSTALRGATDVAARTGGVRSGSFGKTLSAVDQRAGASHLDAVKRAYLALMNARSQRFGQLVGLESNYAANTYGSFVGADVAAQQASDPFANMTRFGNLATQAFGGGGVVG